MAGRMSAQEQRKLAAKAQADEAREEEQRREKERRRKLEEAKAATEANAKSLRDASKSGDVKEVRRLIKEKAPMSAPDLLGFTALHKVASTSLLLELDATPATSTTLL